MEAHNAVSATEILLNEGVILLGVGLFFVILFRRFGLGAVLGYLVAGALVGVRRGGIFLSHTIRDANAPATLAASSDAEKRLALATSND